MTCRASLWSPLTGLLLTLCLPEIVPSAAPQDSPKLPVPEAGAQKEAEKLVRDVFKEDYAKKAISDRRILAQKLLGQAFETQDDAVTRYVLLREAMDVGIQAGDVEAAFRAVDKLAEHYAVQPSELRAKVLGSAEKVARTPEDFKRISAGYIQGAEEQTSTDQLEAAEKSLESALQSAKKSKDIALVTRVESRSKEVKELRTRRSAAQAAEKVLTSTPDDPAANSTVGLYRCLRGDWAGGLPLLVKGPDGPLKETAKAELGGPAEVSAQLGLADGWWALSEKESGSARAALRKHAADWYERAQPHATGLSKARIEKRLAELKATSAPAAKTSNVKVDLLKLLDPAKDAQSGSWQHSSEALTNVADEPFSRIQIPYSPPDEYDFEVIAERQTGTNDLEIGLVLGRAQFSVTLDGWNGTASGLSMVDGKGALDNETAFREKVFKATGKTYTIVSSVRKDKVIVTVDGRKIVEWKADANRLSVHPLWVVSDKTALFLGAQRSRFRLTKLLLTPVSGQGKTLR